MVDLQDCVNAARYLVDEGEADGDRLLITGGSAGGYTTICALTFTDVFAAGTTYFGIADLEQFAGGETHKFELEYEHTLVGPYPERADLYKARSPIHFTDRITTPMLVLQGADDRVVPPSQAELIVAALRERGIPHAYLLYEGEGHGFRKAENIAGSLEAELSFYAQVLGFEPAGSIRKLEIENLDRRAHEESELETASSIARAMQSFVIEGGRPLSGTVRASGNKNGALPILAACVLASEEVRLSNVPRIRDVETMVELLADLGADVEWTGPNDVRVDAAGVEQDRPRRRARARDSRVVPARRPAARALRARHRAATGRGRDRPPAARHARARASRLSGPTSRSTVSTSSPRTVCAGTRMYLDEASVMGTENAIMAAVLAEGETVLGNAACEPHIQDLCRFLVSLGAQIEGIGSNVLRIKGVVSARRQASTGSAPITSRSRASSASRRVTGGEVVVEDVEPDDLISIVPAFRRLGDRDGGHGLVRPRPGRSGPARRGRPRRPDPEDRQRRVAGVPGRPDVDRGHRAPRRRTARSSSSRRCSRAGSSSSTSSSRWARGSSSATRTASS